MVHALTLAGCPVHELLDRQATRLARRLVSGFSEQIPVYRRLPREELDGDITFITQHNLRLISRAFRDRRPPGRADLAPLRESAARRAQEGVPLEALLAAYHLGARMMSEWLFADAGPADLDDVLEANRIVLLYMEGATAAVCSAYLEERESLLSQEQHAMHAVVAALLGGDRAALAGLRLPPRYLVLAVAAGRHPDEDGPGGPVAGRRKLHRLRSAVQRFTAEPVLPALDTAGGLVLVPLQGEGPELGELARTAGKAAGVPVWLAAECAPPQEVPAAARLVEEVLEVVRVFEQPPGGYRLADVLLEYQLTRSSQATELLAGLLDPLLDHPDLLRTLTAYLDLGLDRRRTAELLHVHPNTVDYRLRRVVGLTGLDPMDPAHLQRIGAALAARRLTGPPQ
ncbi:PucR family transcriptional regulator [Nonomuraea sp. MG754425]|uniref:PucR family transcriptional regulator n=1 Tax=Nonomuraea sp. MG754425 TaxID=2570319 RepID=UPI001F371DE9|nr:helix-turn-helix domain-containing protein [Nonomuraea sp. MG754425]MCF6467639.1 PucR family transcriptional regulator [Nonomuraea sp. MG754425]